MPANYTRDQVGQTSVVYQRDLHLDPTPQHPSTIHVEEVFLRKCRLEKIAIAGLDQVLQQQDCRLNIFWQPKIKSKFAGILRFWVVFLELRENY